MGPLVGLWWISVNLKGNLLKYFRHVLEIAGAALMHITCSVIHTLTDRIKTKIVWLC